MSILIKESNTYRMVRDNVFFVKDPQRLVIEKSVYKDLTLIAQQHPRKRARLCLHTGLDAPVQEMIIAYDQAVYVRPLRQKLSRSISYQVISGTAKVIEFSDDGQLVKQYIVGDAASEFPSTFKVPASCFRGMFVLSDSFIFYEVNEGPFTDEMTEFADWSPQELQPDSWQQFYTFCHSQLFEDVGIQIRPARAEDFDALKAIHLEAMRPHIERVYGWDELKQNKLFDERFHLDNQFVFTQGDELIGRLIYWWKADRYYLDVIELKEQYRNKGLGKKVIERLFMGAPVELQVYKGSPAVDFYRESGFSLTEEKPNHWLMIKQQ